MEQRLPEASQLQRAAPLPGDHTMTPALRAISLLFCLAAGGAASAQAQTGAGPVTPARCSGTAPPQYPPLLRQTGNHGKVVADFDIDADGTVHHPHIPVSSHPAFEQATLDWLLQVVCQPARQGERPIASHLTMPFGFELKETQALRYAGRDIGQDTFRVPERPAADTAEPFRYDAPPKARYVAPLVYPLALLRSDTSGTARITFLVDPAGQVRNVRVIEASEPDFGLALQASMEAWAFEPARKDGRASWASLARTEDFSTSQWQLDNRDSRIEAEARDLLHRLEAGDDAPIKLTELDRVPRALYQPRPVYPAQLRKSTQSGKAVIEFIIGRDGVARLPAILSADDPQFGWAAATAISRWRFEVPRRGGKPVDVRTRIPVEFRWSMDREEEVPPPASPEGPPAKGER